MQICYKITYQHAIHLYASISSNHLNAVSLLYIWFMGNDVYRYVCGASNKTTFELKSNATNALRLTPMLLFTI